MEYEWLYGCTNTGVRHLNEAQISISNELAAECPDYINSLNLKDDSGSANSRNISKPSSSHRHTRHLKKDVKSRIR